MLMTVLRHVAAHCRVRLEQQQAQLTWIVNGPGCVRVSRGGWMHDMRCRQAEE